MRSCHWLAIAGSRSRRRANCSRSEKSTPPNSRLAWLKAVPNSPRRGSSGQRWGGSHCQSCGGGGGGGGGDDGRLGDEGREGKGIEAGCTGGTPVLLTTGVGEEGRCAGETPAPLAEARNSSSVRKPF